MNQTFNAKKEHDLRAIRAWRRDKVVVKGRKEAAQPLDRCSLGRTAAIECAE